MSISILVFYPRVHRYIKAGYTAKTYFARYSLVELHKAQNQMMRLVDYNVGKMLA